MRWSPEQISGWLSEQGIKLSHERIYQMIWDDKRDGGNLWRCLRRRGKRYNKRAGKNAGRGLIPNRIDIRKPASTFRDHALNPRSLPQQNCVRFRCILHITNRQIDPRGRRACRKLTLSSWAAAPPAPL